MKLIEFINKKKVLNLAIIALTLILSYNFIYKRQIKEEELLKQKINEETKKNETLESIAKKEKTITVYKSLLHKKDANIIINTINSLAKQTGIRITSIRPRPTGEQRNPDYIKIPFNLALSSPDYHTLGKFISEIENFQDFYLIENIKISSHDQTPELSVNLTVSSIAIAD